MKITMKQLANLAGVSVTTVSLILSGKGERFSEETKKKSKAIGYSISLLSRLLCPKSKYKSK